MFDMTDKEKYEKALAYATEKHSGQFRKGGDPYITHPVAVSEMVKDKGIDYALTGLFHDLLEDTDATEEEILALSDEKVLEAVKLLTKEDGYVMAEYVAGIKSNPIAYAVKAADRLHNLRCAVTANEDFRRKYILETIDWYLGFSDEIKEATKALAASINMTVDNFDFDSGKVSEKDI